MVSRRSFLKLLLAVPAVAALPALAQVAESLPEVDPPLLPLHSDGSVRHADAWLSINGVPVQVRSLSVDSVRDSIRTFDGYYSGIRTDKLRAVVLGDAVVLPLHTGFLMGDKFDLVAHFGCGELRAAGALLSYDLRVGAFLEAELEFWLYDVSWWPS